MKVEKGSWNPPGRGGRWRFAMLVFGLCLGGAGAAILVWPQLIIWALAGTFMLVGLFFVLSALLARTGACAPPEGISPSDDTDG